VQSPSVPRLIAAATDWTCQLCPIQRPVQHLVQRLVTPVTSFRLYFFASGAVKNRRFTSTKAPNPTELARWEGERGTQTHLYPSNSTSFAKVLHTTKGSPSCAHVLVFLQSSSSKELATQLATPLDSSNVAKLDHSSGTR
jgi:hypothetical protein